jgi:hypothetical protein
MQKVSATTRHTSMPMTAAISRSSATARIERPSQVRCTSQFSTSIIARAMPAMTSTSTVTLMPPRLNRQLRGKTA